MKRTFAIIVLSLITAISAMAQDGQQKKAREAEPRVGSEVPAADQILE